MTGKTKKFLYIILIILACSSTYIAYKIPNLLESSINLTKSLNKIEPSKVIETSENLMLNVDKIVKISSELDIILEEIKSIKNIKLDKIADVNQDKERQDKEFLDKYSKKIVEKFENVTNEVKESSFDTYGEILGPTTEKNDIVDNFQKVLSHPSEFGFPENIFFLEEDILFILHNWKEDNQANIELARSKIHNIPIN